MYNNAGMLAEALDSLLGQTVRDVGVMLVDDCSTDETEAIARRYVASDSRVRYFRNPRRLGMIGNWRAAFDLAHKEWPDARYFAWGSDHDLWHPGWVDHLVRELDEHPEAVLCYPLDRRVDTKGKLLPRRPWQFDTAGDTSLMNRFARTLRHMSAGNMIYGLFRIDALVRAGVFRHVLVPDRLLLTELSIFGQFRQVSRALWFRRWYGRIFSLDRQRNAFFPDGRPLYAYVPWWISHAATHAINLGVRGSARPEVSRLTGFRVAWRCLWASGLLHVWQQARGMRFRVLEYASGLRPYERKLRLYSRAVWRRASAHWVLSRLVKPFSAKNRRHAMAVVRKQARGVVASMARTTGVALLRGLRAIPAVRTRAIPWLIREEFDTIPSAPVVLHVRGELESLKHTKDPILVGPWLSEVGYELLYWIPFLNWAAEEYGLDSSRLIAVSRGGAASWYGATCQRYVDLFDLYSIDEYRVRNEERYQALGNQKQYEVGRFDREIVARVQEKLGLPAVQLMHPSLMNRLLRYFWFGKAPAGLLQTHTRFAALPKPDPVPPESKLPSDYVAVRFYFRPSFPDTPENRRFAVDVVRRIARDHPVVMLNTGLRLDDHRDLDLSTGMGVHRVDHLMTPQTNLDLQSRIISRARAFVGTYGGLSYLGPYYGVPTVAFYSNASELVAAHVDVTWRLSKAMASPLVMLDVAEAGLVGSVLEAAPVKRQVQAEPVAT